MKVFWLLSLSKDFLSSLTLIVKIIKVSNTSYWYKNRIGDCFEVRLNNNVFHTFDNYYEVIENRVLKKYISFNDCIDYTRCLKIMKLKRTV